MRTGAAAAEVLDPAGRIERPASQGVLEVLRELLMRAVSGHEAAAALRPAQLGGAAAGRAHAEGDRHRRRHDHRGDAGAGPRHRRVRNETGVAPLAFRKSLAGTDPSR